MTSDNCPPHIWDTFNWLHPLPGPDRRIPPDHPARQVYYIECICCGRRITADHLRANLGLAVRVRAHLSEWLDVDQDDATAVFEAMGEAHAEPMSRKT